MAKSNGNGHGPKSYSKFTLADAEALGLEIKSATLFAGVPPVAPSAWLLEALNNESAAIMTDTESAKSNFIIAPIVREVAVRNAGAMSVYPGYEFDVDASRGLTGFCDFLFSKSPGHVLVKAPVFCLVEAKNENLQSGTAQCIAEMYAAKLFNAQQGRPVQSVFGVVTWGQQWQFYQLNDEVVWRDSRIYNLAELPQILGILQYMVDSAF
jgi:hypothetical protein